MAALKFFLIALVAVAAVQAETKESPIVCIEQQLPALRKLVQEAHEKLEQCVGDIREELDPLREEARKVVSDAHAAIHSLVGELKQCEDKACRVEVAKKVVAEVRDAAAKLRQLVRQGIEIIQDKAPEAAKCAQQVLVELQQAEVALVKEIIKCITS